MRYVIAAIAVLIHSGLSFAGDSIRNDQLQFLIDRWLSAQNTGSFSTYASLYSDNFNGIRRSGSKTYTFNHDTWLKDREKMFKKKVKVKINNPEIQISGTTATVTFEQDWESGNYKDKGDKLLVMALENGVLKITMEEMLFSKVIPDSSKKSFRSNNDARATISDNYEFSSKYTSILDKDCSKVTLHLLSSFADAESAYECPALKGWRLFKVYDRDSERSWLNIANRHAVWSTAEQVRINPKYFFGYFPNIDYSQHVEWRVSKDNVPIALIFRVAVTDPNPKTIRADSWLSRLYVIRLKDNEPRFCGTATTNEEARKIADNASKCTDLLIKEKDF